MKRSDAQSPGPARPRTEPTSRKKPNRVLRYFINVWVVLHFTAIVAAAGTMGPTPGYILAVWEVFHPYLQFFFLNHGYNFFAPSPPRPTFWNSRPFAPTARSSKDGFPTCRYGRGCSIKDTSC